MTKPLMSADIERPDPSYQAILDRDGDAVPDVLRLQGGPLPPSAEMRLDRYTSQTIFDREMSNMWGRVWQFACREEQVPEVGDYHVYEIGKRSLLIVRTEGGLKAFHNSCLHRGTKLKQSNSTGNSSAISCPYHGWTWDLEGNLVKVPCEWEFPQLNRSEMKLDEARVACWNTLVFINFAETGPSLEEYLEVLPAHFKSWDFTGWVTAVHARKLLPCNWKAAQDAFIEGYHTSIVHPQCVGTAGDMFAGTCTRLTACGFFFISPRRSAMRPPVWSS